MTENETDRIQELKLRISQWDAEHEHEIQQLRDANQGLKDTLALSQRVALIGSIPSIFWILCWMEVSSLYELSLFQVVQSSGALLIFFVVLAGAARASGLAAHWWFRRSIVNERQATVFIALLADAILFGWVLVLIRW